MSASPIGSTTNTTTDPAVAAAAETKSSLPSAVEFEPPLACIRRILKSSLPASTNVGKDASAAFARASGIFIIYLTACANDFARTSKRQTITANDVLAAIQELEFDEFTHEMKTFLETYRVQEKNKKDAKAKAAAEKTEKGGTTSTTPSSTIAAETKSPQAAQDESSASNKKRERQDGEPAADEEASSSPAAKKAKTTDDQAEPTADAPVEATPVAAEDP